MRRTVTKSIAIIGEGETEWFYFDSLRVACRYPFKVAPDFPQHSDINHILKLVESYLDKQYDYIICLFDMDRLFQFPSEMQLYQRAKKKYGINVDTEEFPATHLHRVRIADGRIIIQIKRYTVVTQWLLSQSYVGACKCHSYIVFLINTCFCCK